MTDPTSDQIEELRASYDRDRERLDTLVGVHSCDRLNGTDRCISITELWQKMAAVNPDALAILLAVAIDQLAEQTGEATA